MDPDGNFVESPWDVVSLVTGVASLVADVRAGNIKGAIIDGIGIVVDAAAVALPGIPGGVGTALKAAGAAANVAGGALSIKDGLENWDVVVPIFKFSKDVRKIIYTTNAIESLNSSYRKLNRQRSVFPSDQALLKALYLATFEATTKQEFNIKIGNIDGIEVYFNDKRVDISKGASNSKVNTITLKRD